MATPQFQGVLIATPQMRSESGLTFRSKQSAVWPADPRGRRGGCEPAGKTCYLPRFHIVRDPQCFRSKIDAHVAKTLESKPPLVQISYSSRLPCNGRLHILPGCSSSRASSIDPHKPT